MDTIVLISGLMFSCPKEKEDSNCPFNEIRQMPILERVEYLKRLNWEGLSFLENYHKECFCCSLVKSGNVKVKNLNT